MKWFLGAILLLLIGLVFQLGLLIYAMYALLGVMLLSRFLAHSWIENITTQRHCSRATAEIGEKLAVAVDVKNTGSIPVAWLLLEDSLPKEALMQRPPRLHVDGRRMTLMQLGSGAQKSLRYQVQFKMRGYYQIGPLLLESGDLFGLHRRYRVATAPHHVLVYPRVVPLYGFDIASRRPIGEVRMTHRLFEDPTRISGVREYEFGDPINRIHWRATARTGKLHSKTFEPSSVAGISIVLDFHRDVYQETSEPHGSELAVTTAASLANAVYVLGQQTGLFSNGRDAADRIRIEGHRHEFRTRDAAREDAGMMSESDRLQPVVVPTRRGPEQLGQILEALARLELTDGLTFAQLLVETASRLPRDATIVAILSRADEQTALVLGNLKRQGFAVTAIVVMHDDKHYPETAGRLIAQGVDVRRVENEISVSALCQQQLV